MKLNLRKFEAFARRRGYANGVELLGDMGCTAAAYGYFRRGGRIGGDLVAELFNRFGEDEVFEFIDFEEDTRNGFKSKYIEIGKKLY